MNRMTQSLMAFVGAVFATASFAAGTDRWAMYQGGPEHSGFVPQRIVANLAAPAWSVQAQPNGTSGIAISDGLVVTTPYTYFQNEAPLVAQDVVTGHVEWSTNFGSLYSVNQPAIDQGVIFLQTSNNGGATYLHAYRVDGTFLWRSPFGSQWERYLGPIVVQGKIYGDGGQYGGMYAFDQASGQQQWFASLTQYDAWSPTWHNGQLLALTDSLNIVSADTGTVSATIPVAGRYSSGATNEAVVAIGDFAYATSFGQLISFDLLGNTIAWTTNPAADGQVTTDGAELFVACGGALCSFDPSTGHFLWSWVPTPQGSIVSNIVATLSHIIVSDGVQTYIVNRVTHQTDATFPSGGTLLAYGADTLVIGSNQNGTLAAYLVPTDSIYAGTFE